MFRPRIFLFFFLSLSPLEKERGATDTWEFNSLSREIPSPWTYLTVSGVTAVLEQAVLPEKITKRYFGSSVVQCLRVTWLQLWNGRVCWKRKETSMASERLYEEDEVQDKGTSTSSWSSVCRQNRFVNDKTRQKLQTLSITNWNDPALPEANPLGADFNTRL